MNRLTVLLAAPVVVMALLTDGLAHAQAEPVPVPAHVFHIGNQSHGPERSEWIVAAGDQEELEREWARLVTVGDDFPPAVDFEHQVVVITSRIAPCLERPREQTASWEDGLLVVYVSQEPTTGECAAMLDRVEWVATIDRDALPGAVTTLVLIGQRGDELARAETSIDGPAPPEPEPTLPETGLPAVALLLLALTSLGAGGTLTRWPARRRRGRP